MLFVYAGTIYTTFSASFALAGRKKTAWLFEKDKAISIKRLLFAGLPAYLFPRW
jgi:hypothetical protein